MTTDESAKDPVRKFINDHISSVAQLEILLLIQTNELQHWSAGDIARELRIDESAALQQMESLRLTGLLQRDESQNYYYQPASEELRAGCIRLAQAYLVRRVTVISQIYSKPTDKLRAFSDAFRLRKDPPGGPAR